MGASLSAERPAWAQWGGGGGPATAFTVGVEEECMLVAPESWNLAGAIDEVLPRLPADVAAHASAETHAAALELATGVHGTVDAAIEELADLRAALRETTESCGLAAAAAGTHPFAVWRDVSVSTGARQALVYGSMRELARREPTFALHVHVGVPDPEDAVRVANRLRVHLPVLLALSANSPFWQGRDTGLASARTPLFQAFPRVGIPRAFDSYEDWLQTVGLLIRCEAFPEPTFLWWDVRLQPALGTVEVRIMDTQTTVEDSGALVALVQCLARLEALEGFADPLAVRSDEVLAENRFIAARDGTTAALIDPSVEMRIPLGEVVERLLAACRPHAEDLGCADWMHGVERLLADPGAERQLALGREPDRLPGLMAALAGVY
ncbi:carboxylate-amine ligase [Capillimicrobium parvum]|uniref:Putative glutamate--cysteine ligase 2 n=1 Tax=Capillimicrobium parvum TaxID=2884022 RepID=A0A9E7C1F8_9ACTN|nr:YbdK family carboxylate-amine ligase [Capillimicrobium parvum]UGS37440.1 Putative glutamate--cysteine ligase 2 [Capillimicrobium parvum]